jgi:phosphatidate cytidylyltransferase
MAPLSAAAETRVLVSRILSGAVLAPLAVLLVAMGGLAFDLAVAAAAAIGLAEWLRLVTRWSRPSRIAAGSVLAILGVVAAYRVGGPFAALACVALAASAVGLIVRANNGKAGLLAAFGLPYVGLTLVSLIWLRRSGAEGWSLVLFLFLVVWGSDIGAYVAGRSLGGPKLAPAISPNKTWAGFGGGLFLSACIAMIWNASMAQTARPLLAALFAVGLSLLGQGGDLFESMMKRRFGVKDSGNLIPGHGGMLDRIDALLWVAPAFAALYWLGLTRGLLS